jgi:hypothetical protein
MKRMKMRMGRRMNTIAMLRYLPSYSSNARERRWWSRLDLAETRMGWSSSYDLIL